MKTKDYSYIHPEEKWTGRANTLKRISDLIESRNEFEGKVRVDRDALYDVIYREYPLELQSFKQRNDLDKLDRHKVAALSTILVFRANLIKVSNQDRNGFCILARHMHSCFLGLSRIGDPEFLISNNEDAFASIYSQLESNELIVTALSNQYHLIEQSVSLSKRQII